MCVCVCVCVSIQASKPVHLQLVGLRGGLAALAHKQLPSMAHWHVTRTEQPWADFYKSEIDKVGDGDKRV